MDRSLDSSAHRHKHTLEYVDSNAIPAHDGHAHDSNAIKGASDTDTTDTATRHTASSEKDSGEKPEEKIKLPEGAENLYTDTEDGKPLCQTKSIALDLSGTTFFCSSFLLEVRVHVFSPSVFCCGLRRRNSTRYLLTQILLRTVFPTTRKGLMGNQAQTKLNPVTKTQKRN